MNRRFPAFVLCLLLICSIFIPISLGGNVKNIPHQPVSNIRGNTLYVGGSGPDNYTGIQDAIDDASDGDTVFVYDDSSPYYGALEIDKSINLIGEDRNTTVIAGYEWINLNIYTDWVNFSGFTISLTSSDIGISLDSYSNVNITGNKVNNGYIGILLSDNSSGNTLMDNIILGNTFGIQLTNSNNNIIKVNEFISNEGDGLKLQSSHNNNISENIFRYNQHDLLLEFSCANNIIIGNIFLDTLCCHCISFSDSDNNSVISNKMKPNWGTGIGLYKSHNNTIILNSFFDSYYSCGINIRNSFNNIIYHNNFINNRPQSVYDDSINIWDNNYPSGGNYWDDYNGTDSNGDGIGDTPYLIPGGNNEDRYPLIEPWSSENKPPNAPDILGPTHGDSGDLITFTFSSMDPDKDDVRFHIDWGDGETDTTWYVGSGDDYTISHSWKGDDEVFTITVCAEDSKGLTGPESTFDITIPRTRTIYNSYWMQFFDMFLVLQRILGFML